MTFDFEKDQQAVLSALQKWWQSQGISPKDAAFLMARFAGLLCAVVNNPDTQENLQLGVSLLSAAMLSSAINSRKRLREPS
jgi:hypothetical protein